MKLAIGTVFCFFYFAAAAQSLQLQYDFRHTINNSRNPRNYPTVYFEYLKVQDSGRSMIKPGAFLFKMQTDFSGLHNNAGQLYMQVSQSFRCWQPKIFLNLQYGGGLGITEPRQYSYYIINTFSVGLSYPFKWGKAYLTSVLNARYAAYGKPSYDASYTLYWWKGCFNYKLEVAGDFSIWTENKNHGDAATSNLQGKRFFFYGEPQLWYKCSRVLAVGTRINLQYHLATAQNILEVYPALTIRFKL